MKQGMYVRLSGMMFLEFFVWGAWYVTVGNYMGAIGMTDLIYWAYTVGPIGAIISPFFLGMVVIAYIVLKYFRYGRFLYAIGGNKKAAYVSGINTNRITLTAYIVGGLCNAMAGNCVASDQGLSVRVGPAPRRP